MVAYGYHRTHLNSWNLDKEEQCMWHKCRHYLIQKGATSCLKLDAGDEKRVHFWWSNEHISTNHNTCLSLNILNSSYVFEPTNNLTFNAFGRLGEFQKAPPSNPMIQALSICALPEESLLNAMRLSMYLSQDISRKPLWTNCMIRMNETRERY